jgi:hypothetical protein
MMIDTRPLEDKAQSDASTGPFTIPSKADNTTEATIAQIKTRRPIWLQGRLGLLGVNIFPPDSNALA